MTEEVWSPLPLVNIVMEALERLSKGGSLPVKESDVIAYVESAQYYQVRPSRADVVRTLIVLETLGIATVKSSGWRERIIIYKPGSMKG